MTGKMNGTLPDSVFNLKHMRIIKLSGHSFQGSIKSEIGNLTNLTELLIDSNLFTGTLPSELGLCEKLGEDSDMFLFNTSRKFYLNVFSTQLNIN